MQELFKLLLHQDGSMSPFYGACCLPEKEIATRLPSFEFGVLGGFCQVNIKEPGIKGRAVSYQHSTTAGMNILANDQKKRHILDDDDVLLR